MNTRIRAQFLGGVAYGDDNLTGSSVLLTVEQRKQSTRLLIDAGLVQCYKDSLSRNMEILHWLKPVSIDGIVLTHAHIDHTGRLPLLVKNGFNNRIYCTEATSGLLPVMLEDSAKIQIKEAANLKAKMKKLKETGRKADFSRDQMTRGNYDKKKQHSRRKAEILQPLYDLDDVWKTCRLVKNGGFPYQEWIRLAKGIDLKFYPSGHVLGGAICVIKVESTQECIYIGFSGDLGRSDGIILPPPEMVNEPISYWFIESTYGGKVHPAREEETAKLLNLIKAAAVSGQKVIIPSFALERAQEIVYLLSYYMKTAQIPKIPIFLDSPMATNITKVFAANWDLGMFEGQDKLDFNPFRIEGDSFLRTINGDRDSLALSEKSGPYIVIAASGMCDAGRVRTHLRAGLGNINTVVALIGYMTKNSLGRKLKDGLPIVRMNGTEIVVKAKVVSFDSFSAHADGPHLVNYTKEALATGDNERQKIFIVHGEEKGATSLKIELLESLPHNGWLKQIIIPKLGEEVIL
jgi:metallo-beta-lactamase family protein